MPKRRPVIVLVVGPTAVGKTHLALSLAGRLGGEIISADSMQAYRRMPILSQAPSPAEKRAARHHLTEFIDPREEYSVARFGRRATRIIRSLVRRRRVPIVVGGSGLYIKALVDGIFPSPPADLEFRRRLERSAKRYGSGRLHERLTAIDPAAAALIHPNDLRRIIRALEIHHATGRTMTELKRETKGLAALYDIRFFGLIRPRRDLYRRIDERVEQMFRAPVIAEAKRLLRKKLSRTAQAVLGLKEIAAYLDGACDLDAAKDQVKAETRRFAKRQLTWFRADKRIVWFNLSRTARRTVIARISANVRKGTRVTSRVKV